MTDQVPFSSALIDIPQMLALARSAGQIGLKYFQNIAPQRKADDSFVTQADIEIEAYLTSHIRAAYPSHNLIGEEGALESHNPDAPTWAIDPLDGTTAFVHGLPGWGIALGLLFQGAPVFGLFYMPLLDDMTYTAADGTALHGEQNLAGLVQPNWANKGFLAINSSAHRRFVLNVPRIRTLGSVGANLMYTARGAAVASLIPKAHIWDLVAGAAILHRAGGELQYLSGQPIDYQPLLTGQLAPGPIIAAHPQLLPELRQKITVSD